MSRDAEGCKEHEVSLVMSTDENNVVTSINESGATTEDEVSHLTSANENKATKA